MTKWVVTLEEDAETGELIMPLPDELLVLQGWQVGDVLTCNVDIESGTATLTKQ